MKACFLIYLCRLYLKMIRKLGHIILSFWLITITTGVLVNHHFSKSTLFSSSLFFEAESCCQNSSSDDAVDFVCEISDPDFSCTEVTEQPTCCSEAHRPEKPFGHFIIQESDCCSQSSSFFQLAQVFFADKSLKGFEIPVSPLSSFAMPNLFSTLKINLIKPGHPPPLLNKTPIFIDIASFRC